MNMAAKQYMNHLILEIVHPSTTLFDLVWKARLRAIVAKLAGQTAWDG